MTPRPRDYPWILWPFVAIWDLLAFVLNLTGRLVGTILGIALMITGIALCFTLVGLPLGIPLAMLGGALMLRSVF
ncbi:MAG: hypothetical protein ACYDIE_01050 [Candidatus Krumholzibacteriia bacterium]